MRYPVLSPAEVDDFADRRVDLDADLRIDNRGPDVESDGEIPPNPPNEARGSVGGMDVDVVHNVGGVASRVLHLRGKSGSSASPSMSSPAPGGVSSLSGVGRCPHPVDCSVVDNRSFDETQE